MEKVNITIKIEIDMKANGEKEKKKGKEYIIGNKEINLKDILKMIKKMNMVNIFIKTEKSMRAK